MIDDTVLDHLEIIICCWDLLWRKIQVRIIQVWWWIRWKLPILMWTGTLTLAGRLPPSSATQAWTNTNTITISTFQCLSDPSGCAAPGNTNMFGYPAHFDLQNANLQVDHMDQRCIFCHKKLAQKNGPKMTQNCPKWPKIAQIDPKLPKWPKNDPKWPKN